MKIALSKLNGKYEADITDLPGSPPIGRASTPEDAVADMFARLIADKRSSWLTMLDLSKVEISRL